MLVSSNCTVVYLVMPFNELHCLITVSATETDLEYCVGLLQCRTHIELIWSMYARTSMDSTFRASCEKKYIL